VFDFSAISGFCFVWTDQTGASHSTHLQSGAVNETLVVLNDSGKKMGARK
jgi:hypothetical protein